MPKYIWIVIYKGSLLYIGDRWDVAKRLSDRFGVEIIEVSERDDTMYDFSRKIKARKTSYVDNIYQEKPWWEIKRGGRR